MKAASIGTTMRTRIETVNHAWDKDEDVLSLKLSIGDKYMASGLGFTNV